MVQRILGATVFFVLPKEKGNTSGSWASPQEVSLGLIKGAAVDAVISQSALKEQEMLFRRNWSLR